MKKQLIDFVCSVFYCSCRDLIIYLIFLIFFARQKLSSHVDHVRLYSQYKNAEHKNDMENSHYTAHFAEIVKCVKRNYGS